jgi:hypothetical protein
VFAAIYAAQISDDNPARAEAKESIEDATDLANSLDGASRVDLIEDAVRSFDVASRWGLAVCMAVLLLAAVNAAAGLRDRKGGRPLTRASAEGPI